jgi:uncharacterized integral membrane protein
MRTLLQVLVLVSVVAYAIWLVTANGLPVKVTLLPGTTLLEVSAWLLLLGAFVSGALLVGLGLAWPLLRLRLRVRRQSRSIARLEQEVHGLRTLPLTEETSPGGASAQEG